VANGANGHINSPQRWRSKTYCWTLLDCSISSKSKPNIYSLLHHASAFSLFRWSYNSYRLFIWNLSEHVIEEQIILKLRENLLKIQKQDIPLRFLFVKWRHRMHPVSMINQIIRSIFCHFFAPPRIIMKLFSKYYEFV